VQGKEIIDHFIKQLKDEGITEVPLWDDPNPGAAEKVVPAITDQKRASVKRRKSGGADGTVSGTASRKASESGATAKNVESDEDEFHSGSEGEEEEEEESVEQADATIRRRSNLERTFSTDGEHFAFIHTYWVLINHNVHLLRNVFVKDRVIDIFTARCQNAKRQMT
jgi:hypothetical protein